MTFLLHPPPGRPLLIIKNYIRHLNISQFIFSNHSKDKMVVPDFFYTMYVYLVLKSFCYLLAVVKILPKTHTPVKLCQLYRVSTNDLYYFD